MDISDPYDDLDARFAVHQQTQQGPYQDEEERFKVHSAETVDAAETTAHDPYAIEDDRFLIHTQHMAAAEHERLQQKLADVSLDFDEDSRFRVHMLQHANAERRAEEDAKTKCIPAPCETRENLPATGVSITSVPTTSVPNSGVPVTAAAAVPPPDVSKDPTPEPEPPSSPKVPTNLLPEGLVAAVKADDTVAVGALLLAEPALLHAVDDKGRCPLFLAALHRSHWCLMRLLQHTEAVIDRCDYQGTTALHVACWKHGDHRIIAALCSAGADCRRKPWAGGLRQRSALEIAKYYKRSKEVMSLLRPPPWPAEPRPTAGT